MASRFPNNQLNKAAQHATTRTERRHLQELAKRQAEAQRYIKLPALHWEGPTIFKSLWNFHHIKHFKGYLWALLLIVLIGGGTWIHYTQTVNANQDAAARIVKRDFNSEQTDITGQASDQDMSNLKDRADQIHDHKQATHYRQLANAGEQALDQQRKIDNFTNMQGLFLPTLTADHIRRCRAQLGASNLQYSLPAFYSKKYHYYTKLIKPTAKVDHLHQQTLSLLSSTHRNQVKKGVSLKKVNRLMNQVGKHLNYQLAKDDFHRLQKAQKQLLKETKNQTDQNRQQGSSSSQRQNITTNGNHQAYTIPSGRREVTTTPGSTTTYTYNVPDDNETEDDGNTQANHTDNETDDSNSVTIPNEDQNTNMSN